LKKLFLFFISLILIHTAFTQVRFSLATGISLLRNFSPEQRFWSIGQGVQANLHITKTETAYAWLNFHKAAKFQNSFLATAKSPATSPAQLEYRVAGQWKFRQFSLGWKHYFKGSFDNEDNVSLYGAAGFGLLFAKAQNTLASPLDTTLYSTGEAPVIGNGAFKRLTLDLAMGAEYPLSGNIFLFGDLRTSLHTSDYPSPLFHDPTNIPLPLVLNAGIRILFGYGD
jgi:hypothetical protein